MTAITRSPDAPTFTLAGLAADENRAVAHFAGVAHGYKESAREARDCAARRVPWPGHESGVGSWEALAKLYAAIADAHEKSVTECKAILT
ncbi:hypothetical protein [Georgenia wangjunii]|uniref:hypothetical protein n=1 Tax=Georgenia wangjunii TaxID=3117730 RepID=UPI002F267860